MSEDGALLLCTLDRPVGRTVGPLLGLVMGSCRVTEDKAGKWSVADGERSWPWAEDPEHYEMLFRLAEADLREKARSLGAEAVIGIRAQTDRDVAGRPGIALIGTAIRFGPGQEMEPARSGQGSGPDGTERLATPGVVSIAFEGRQGEWEPMEARGGPLQPTDDPKSIQALADGLGIAQDRAAALFKAGLRTVRDVATSRVPELARICGLNPTQARILLESAKEALAEEGR